MKIDTITRMADEANGEEGYWARMKHYHAETNTVHQGIVKGLLAMASSRSKKSLKNESILDLCKESS